MLFHFLVPKQWNYLPTDTHHIQSSHAFKTALQTCLYKVTNDIITSQSDLKFCLQRSWCLQQSSQRSWCLQQSSQRSHFTVTSIKPFAAPAGKISGLKLHGPPTHSIFSGPITSTLMLCVLMKLLSHASGRKKTKRLKGFLFHTFNRRFQITSWQ